MSISRTNKNNRSFTLLYLKSFAIGLNEEVDEKTLLDQLNKGQRRKSVVDRMGQVVLTLAEDALILSKPLWWSTRSGQRLPYTQLREAYVFGQDNKRIAIDILSRETQQRRVLLFKTRNLDEREELIELLTKRKMVGEMYEKDNIHQVQYANWSSTYADDMNHRNSHSQSQISTSPEETPPETPVYYKAPVQSLTRQPFEQAPRQVIVEEEPAVPMPIVPIGLGARQMREVSLQSGREIMQQWPANDWRQQGTATCCGHERCHQSHQPSQQHNHIHIVLQGQPALVIASETGVNPSKMNEQIIQYPSDTVVLNTQPAQLQPMVNIHSNATKEQTPSQWNRMENICGRTVRLIGTEQNEFELGTKQMNLPSSMVRYPSQMNLEKEAKISPSDVQHKSYSQPDLVAKSNSIDVRSSIHRNEQSTRNSNSGTDSYQVLHVRNADERSKSNMGHTHHTTLVTKTGNQRPIAHKLGIQATSSRHYKDQVICERISEVTHRSKPQKSEEIHVVPSSTKREICDAHHGWAKETKFYEVHDNKLATVTKDGSRYATIIMEKPCSHTTDHHSASGFE